MPVVEPTKEPVKEVMSADTLKEIVKELTKEPVKAPVVKDPTPTPVLPQEHKVHIVIEQQKPKAEAPEEKTQKSQNITLPKTEAVPLPPQPKEEKKVEVAAPPKPSETPLKSNEI